MVSKGAEKDYLTSYVFSVPQRVDFCTPTGTQIANSLVENFRFVFISVVLKLLFASTIAKRKLSSYEQSGVYRD
ncbi:MAG: hypothetical protein GXY60_06270 [Spirochaetales bacterium]|nr:hypothetical protein [Spirochaetales bacterium]